MKNTLPRSSYTIRLLQTTVTGAGIAARQDDMDSWARYVEGLVRQDLRKRKILSEENTITSQ